MASSAQRMNHPAMGAVPTAAQKALLQESASGASTNTLFTATQRPAANAVGSAAATFNTTHVAANESSEEEREESGSAASLSSRRQTSSANPLTSTTPAVPLPQAVPPSHKNSNAEGMRREWKFALQFVHQAGQLLVQCSPLWEYQFIDIDRTAVGLAQRELSHQREESTPMLALLSYTDRTAVVQILQPTNSAAETPKGPNLPISHANTGRSNGGALPGSGNGADGGLLLEHSSAMEDSMITPSIMGDDEVDGGGQAWWLEKSKSVEVFYCHCPPSMDLVGFCKRCVQFALRDPHVTSVDGDTRLSRLRVGDKLRCPYQLGGLHRSFHFHYILRDRSELQEIHIYAIGAIVGQRGYLLRARCTDAEELEGYVRTAVLPTYATRGRAMFGVDVTYHNVVPTTALSQQQEAFGELQYVDHKAAIVFATTLYPMRVLPDYSPAKTVGVGSITCLTLELNVRERLLDDAVAAEIAGVAKYKVSTVIVCVEVEEVARMGYPKVMSTEQYSDLKATRVTEVFPDAKTVGLHTNLLMGDRTGRSRTLMFTYEPLRAVVKALITSTLVGNLGVTVFYLTKPSAGVFDAHLYIVQQLLSGIEYLPQNSSARSALVSRFHSQNIRLVAADVTHAYRSALPAGGLTGELLAIQNNTTAPPFSPSALMRPHPTEHMTTDLSTMTETRDLHLRFLSLINDGRVEGGVEVTVPPEEGGFVPTRHSASAGNTAATNLHHPRITPRDVAAAAAAAEAAAEAGIFANGVDPGVSAAPLFMYPLGSEVSLTALARADSASVTEHSFGGSRPPTHRGTFTDGRDGAEEEFEEEEVDPMMWSAHSSSRISVSELSHLLADGSVTPEGERSASEGCEAEDLGHSTRTSSHGNSPVCLSPQAPVSATAADKTDPISQSCHSSVTVDAGGSKKDVVERRERRGSASGSASVQTLCGMEDEGGDGGAGDVSGAPPASPSSVLSSSGVHGAVTPDRLDKDVINAVGKGVKTAPVPLTKQNDAALEAERLEQQRLYEQLIGKGDAAVQQALGESEAGTLYGPSLRDVYAHCCEAQQCRPNSYLMRKLPVQPEFTYAVEEVDLSSNYVGHNGFVAVLHLLEHLPRLRVVYFNNMSLDNVDAESLCYVLATNRTVLEVHLENNTGISLPSMRHFTALLRVNPRINVLKLAGTHLSPILITKLAEEASRSRA